MGKKAKSLLKIAAVYLGAVLGAGFASGQELMLFFVRFSERGLPGCLLAGGLFALFGALILRRAYALPEKSLRCYLRSIFSEKTADVFQLALEFYLCISFCVMLSGSGAFFKERFGLTPAFGILAADLLCLAVFLYDLQGIAVINLLLTPIMLAGTAYVCLYSLFSGSVSAWLPQFGQNGRPFFYALLYVGYNILTAAAVLVSAGSLAEDKRTAAQGGALGGFMLCAIAFLCCLALHFGEEVWVSSLPMLLLSERAGSLAYVSYSAVLFMAMLTTAVSSGFSLVKSLTNRGLSSKKAVLLVCTAALPLSFTEFSALIAGCYTFFGAIGIFLIAGILWDWYRRMR